MLEVAGPGEQQRNGQSDYPLPLRNLGELPSSSPPSTDLRGVLLLSPSPESQPPEAEGSGWSFLSMKPLAGCLPEE